MHLRLVLLLLVLVLVLVESQNTWYGVATNLYNLISSCSNTVDCSTILTGCPAGATTSATSFQGIANYTDTQKCQCLKQTLTCAYKRCPSDQVTSGCNSVKSTVTTIQSNFWSVCDMQCSAGTTQSWYGVAANLYNLISSCNSNVDCSTSLTSCPVGASTSSSSFQGIAAYSDTQKCQCLKQALTCAYKRCPSDQVTSGCNSMKSTVTTIQSNFWSVCDMACSAGWNVQPSLILLSSLVLGALGMVMV